jgi:hypothetical protein
MDHALLLLYGRVPEARVCESLVRRFKVSRATALRSVRDACDALHEFSPAQLAAARRLARRRLLRWIGLAEKSLRKSAASTARRRRGRAPRGLRVDAAIRLALNSSRQLHEIEGLDRIDPVLRAGEAPTIDLTADGG